jgi:SAM-dependent methyltransferase
LHCIVCDLDADVSSFGVVAPFITELAASPAKSAVTLQHCDSCQLSFFSHRYSDAELKAIYGGYRAPAYVKIRQRWEPWYRAAVNDAYRAGSGEVDVRRAFMQTLIARGGQRLFRMAVDFGGDEGQFFPDSATRRKVVVDVSGQPLREGIESCEDLKSLQGTPDLVMICHVLEHLNDPVALLREVHQVLDAGGVLYVEVPLDMPRLHPWHSRDAYRRYLAVISRTRWLLLLADFVAGVSRQRGLRIPRLGLVKQSEHINYFTESSLHALLAKAGFRVRDCGAEPNASFGGLRLGKLGMVAVKAGHAL